MSFYKTLNQNQRKDLLVSCIMGVIVMKPNEKNLEGKTYLVTGGSSGIGKATAFELARLRAEVIIVSRDPNRGQAALHDLRKRSGNPAIHLHLADLSSLNDIRRLTEIIQDTFPHLHALVNVAGSMFQKRTLTADGLEMNFALNYFTYFMLTNLLLDKLMASAPAHIVNVTSIAHWWGRINFDDLQNQHRYNMFAAYGDAKLAIVLFTKELARRMASKGVIVNCVHPGFVATHIIGRVVNHPLAYRFADLFFLTPPEAARTIVYLASSPDAVQFQGEYLVRKKIGWASGASSDMQMAQRLWTASEHILNNHKSRHQTKDA